MNDKKEMRRNKKSCKMELIPEDKRKKRRKIQFEEKDNKKENRALRKNEWKEKRNYKVRGISLLKERETEWGTRKKKKKKKKKKKESILEKRTNDIFKRK